MSIQHSSTPWHTVGTIISDVHGNPIADVRGNNEQSIATAAHIVERVNMSRVDDVKQLDARQVAAIMAGLRLYQSVEVVPEDILSIATDGETLLPLESGEIDELCEELNNGFLIGSAR